MNKKIFTILIIIMTALSCLLGSCLIVFGLQNASLKSDNNKLSNDVNHLLKNNENLANQNNDLDEKNKNLNNKVDNLQSIIDEHDHLAIITYQVNGKDWKYDVVKKGEKITLPDVDDEDQYLNYWKIDGVDVEYQAYTLFEINKNITFKAEMLDKLVLTYIVEDEIVETVKFRGSNYTTIHSYDEYDNETYYFDGWYLNGDKNKSYKSGQYFVYENTSFVGFLRQYEWSKMTGSNILTTLGSESDTFDTDNIWSDGTNTYYSGGAGKQYIFDKQTKEWRTYEWDGDVRNIEGKYIWKADGKIYYHNGPRYTLDTSTNSWIDSNTNLMTGGSSFWSDGGRTFYSNGERQKLIRDTENLSDFVDIQWGLPENINPENLWKDNDENVYYYSTGGNNYKLEKNTYRWDEIVISGLPGYIEFSPEHVWLDDNDVYFSKNGCTFILDKNEMKWYERRYYVYEDYVKTLNIDGSRVWTDGEDYYYIDFYSNTQYILN